MTDAVGDTAGAVLAALDARAPATVLEAIDVLDIDTATAVQAEVCRRRQRRGEAVVGYKVGCTSPATQRQFGIDQPVCGRLFASQRWPSGARLDAARFAELGVEGELAVRLGRDVDADDVRSNTLVDAIAATFVVVELHHFGFLRGRRPTASTLIATNAIHAGYVFAAHPAPGFIDSGVSLRLAVDDAELATVDGGELRRTALASLRWLAGELRRRGSRLQAGQTVLCGSVAKLFPVPSNCRISAVTKGFGCATCTVAGAFPPPTGEANAAKYASSAPRQLG